MISLTTPIAVKEVTGLEVRSVQFEANTERGQHWVDVYCDYGFTDRGLFRAYPVPGMNGSSVLHLRFENGRHPAEPGKMLGKCQSCETWVFAVSGTCACSGIIAPHTAYDDFMAELGKATASEILIATERYLVAMDFPSINDEKIVEPIILGSQGV